MTTIDDFTNRRWEDAKQALRELDSDFVGRLESEHRLQTLGLDMPELYSVGFTPKRRLSKKWHHLLESCLELTMQVRSTEVAAAGQTRDANAGLPICEVGLRADYHHRSWFIHAQTLAERTNDVIRKATAVYIAEPAMRREVAKRYTTRVNQQIAERVKEQRNDYVHPRRSWPSGITEDQLWEGNVVVGITPAKFLDDFHFPAVGNYTMAGKYDVYVAETTKMLNCVGSILHDLEGDL